jgi:hypothetical protein
VKFPIKNGFLVFSNVWLLSSVFGCAFEEKRTSEKTYTETCMNGRCTSTTTTSESKRSGSMSPSNTSNSTFESDGGTIMVGSSGGTVSGSVSVVSAGGEIKINACQDTMAPVSACADAGAGNVMMPKHIGCTASGAHVWVCRDMISGPPPYPVIACNGLLSSNCSRIGQQF